MLNQGTKILDALMNASRLSKTSEDQPEINADDIMKTSLKQLTRGFEPEFGGFSEAPKFPQTGLHDHSHQKFARDFFVP